MENEINYDNSYLSIKISSDFWEIFNNVYSKEELFGEKCSARSSNRTLFLCIHHSNHKYLKKKYPSDFTIKNLRWNWHLTIRVVKNIFKVDLFLENRIIFSAFPKISLVYFDMTKRNSMIFLKPCVSMKEKLRSSSHVCFYVRVHRRNCY